MSAPHIALFIYFAIISFIWAVYLVVSTIYDGGTQSKQMKAEVKYLKQFGFKCRTFFPSMCILGHQLHNNLIATLVWNMDELHVELRSYSLTDTGAISATRLGSNTRMPATWVRADPISFRKLIWYRAHMSSPISSDHVMIPYLMFNMKQAATEKDA